MSDFEVCDVGTKAELARLRRQVEVLSQAVEQLTRAANKAILTGRQFRYRQKLICAVGAGIAALGSTRAESNAGAGR